MILVPRPSPIVRSEMMTTSCILGIGFARMLAIAYYLNASARPPFSQEACQGSTTYGIQNSRLYSKLSFTKPSSRRMILQTQMKKMHCLCAFGMAGYNRTGLLHLTESVFISLQPFIAGISKEGYGEQHHQLRSTRPVSSSFRWESFACFPLRY